MLIDGQQAKEYKMDRMDKNFFMVQELSVEVRGILEECLSVNQANATTAQIEDLLIKAFNKGEHMAKQ